MLDETAELLEYTEDPETITSYVRYAELSQLARLVDCVEQDRLRRRSLLSKVRFEFFNLVQKLEELGILCYQQLPLIVQKEHELAVSDLLRMRYDIETAQDEFDQMSTRVKTLQAVKQKMDVEIQRVAGCTSLVNEKSAIEQEEMGQLKELTATATKDLEKANEKMNEAEVRYTLAVKRAERTRIELDQDVKKAEDDLERFQGDLKEALETYPRLVDETRKLKEQVNDSERQLQFILDRFAQRIDQVAESQLRADDIARQLAQSFTLTDDLEHWFHVNSENFNTRFHGKLDQEFEALYQEYVEALERYNMVHTEECELVADVQMYEERKRESTKAIARAEKNLKTAKVHREETARSFMVAQSDLASIKLKHDRGSQELSDTKTEVKQSENRMRDRISVTEHNISEETKTRATVLAKIQRDIAELELAREISIEKRKELGDLLEEVEEDAHLTEQRVAPLREQHEESVSVRRGLIDDLETLTENWKEKKSNLVQQVENLINKIGESGTESICLQSELEQIRANTIQLNEKQAKLEQSTSAILKVKLRAETKSKQLKCTLAEMESLNKIQKSQLQSKSEHVKRTESRQSERHGTQHKLVHSRKNTMTELKQQLAGSMNNNRQLAQQYRQNQEQQSSLVTSFYAAVSQLKNGQSEMCDREQLLALCTRTRRRTNVDERRSHAKLHLTLDELQTQMAAISCRLRTIQGQGERYFTLNTSTVAAAGEAVH